MLESMSEQMGSLKRVMTRQINQADLAAGGAEKIKMVCRLLRDMGYSRVVGILDNDKEDIKIQCQEEFKGYKFVLLPAADIHDKSERTIPAKDGLLQKGGHLREDKRAATIEMYEEINAYLKGNPDGA